MAGAFQSSAFQNSAFQTDGTAPVARRGATWLSQAELRRLRKERDTQEARERDEQQTVGRTIEQTYENITNPKAMIARQAEIKDPARTLQDAEDMEFMAFLLDNYETLH